MKRTHFALILCLWLITPLSLLAQKRKKKETQEVQDPLKDVSLSTFKFRNVGPALTSGRIADIAVNPTNHSEFYVAAAAGGVWKTTNSGTTFQPIFDNYGSYSIGALALDPNNPSVLWVGSGENNNQRSVSYGDGIYKSIDGGASFTNLGLKESEHIGMIKIDPRNSDVVYVAAIGPLWSEGGDRGLYKTTDGGKTWKKVLEVSEHTGINEIHLDPRNPDVLYATAHQRRRRQWTYLGGGPESGIYKSIDAGSTWTKINKGLPIVDKGRIGMAISPANPEVIYVIVEAQNGKGGFYRSTNRGASWDKMSSYSTSGNYYQEIVADPVDVDRVYSVNTFTQVTTDGGKTFQNLGEKSKHWDNHAIWINPQNNQHILQGCDGGVYESFDQGKNWKFFTNLPVTQFYKVSVDNAEPFYNIMGGTQDNYSLHGPSETTSEHGILSSDWIVTLGGDGFESVADPTDENIIYSQYQNGGLVRFDKKSGEMVMIQPKPRKGEKAYNFNWDSPLMISPHNNKTLYYAANKLFRSNDKGDSWEVISGELDQDIDRNLLPVMGKVWPMDAVAKNGSTSRYGAGVSLDESRLQEGLIYVGSDDGQISITEDAGESWFKINQFPGVPKNTYVYDLVASKHNRNIVYAAFNNHKSGDFTPYIYKSTDKGRSWTNISANLPEGAVYAIEQDHVNANILFVGTEYGVYVSLNEGQTWTELESGLPTINVRDMMIQERENDLVLGTFGRGFYVLDDYSTLREISEELKKKEAHLFAISNAYMYNTWTPLGSLGSQDKGFQGETFYSAKNPEQGAIIKYWVKDEVSSLKSNRTKREKEQFKKGESIAYPTVEEYYAEQNEAPSYLVFTIQDSSGETISELRSPYKNGLNKITWDMTYMDFESINSKSFDPTKSLNSSNIYVVPGTYTVTLNAVVKGQIKEWNLTSTIQLKELNNRSIPADNWAEMTEFKKDAVKLLNALNKLSEYIIEAQSTLDEIKAASKTMPLTEGIKMSSSVNTMEKKLDDIKEQLNGNSILNRLDKDADVSTTRRAQSALFDVFGSLSNVTGTSIRNYEIASNELANILEEAKIFDQSLGQLLASYNGPDLRGNIPKWTKN